MRNIQNIVLILLLHMSMFDISMAQNINDIFPNSKASKERKQKRYAQQQAEKYLIEGMKFYALDDYEEALEQFFKSEEAKPASASIKFQIAKTYYQLNNFEKTIEYADKANALESDNPFFYDLKLQVYRQQNDPKSVIETVKQLIEHVEEVDKEYYLDLASAYIQSSDYQQALVIFQDIENKFGYSEKLLDLQQRCLLSLNRIDEAIQLGEKRLEEAPNSEELFNAHIRLLLSLEKTEDAEKWLTKYEENFEVSGEWHMLRARVYDLQGNEELFLIHIREAFKDPTVSLQSKIQPALRYFPYEQNEKKSVETGKELTALIYKAHPSEPKAYEIYAEFLLIDKDHKEAREVYLEALKLNENNFGVWQKVVELDAQLGEYDLLIEHTDQATIIYPNQPFFFLFNGIGHQLTGSHDIAVDMLEQAEMLSITSDDNFKLQLYSQLGDAYQQIKNYEKSNESYESALKIDKNNVYVLNNYSYYLSIRNENIERALVLAEKLISLAPDNPSYLDTYGWVLYTSGQYAEARSYLEKAATSSPKNATIVEHYGDALYKLGEVDQAVEQWQKAKDIGGNYSEYLDRKLAERKLVDKPNN